MGREISIEALGELATVHLPGELIMPEASRGLVLFAHGSGSSRLSPRNVMVARALQDRGFGTLLFDLLTEEESSDRANVFDVALLARRLLSATDWIAEELEVSGEPFGYFGASTGAAAALWAAARPGNRVGAIVSRGGRPDLAGTRLSDVVAPTLLIVGGRDQAVLELNREAQLRLRCANDVAVVAGATHLFEEPGALEEVARLAGEWFARYLGTKEQG